MTYQNSDGLEMTVLRDKIKQLIEENARLRAALENCKPVMESHAGTTRLALFNEALKGQP